MFNDVHVAKVSKIQEVINSRRNMGRVSKSIQETQAEDSCDLDRLSPCRIVSAFGIDSPEPTHRDPNESDNNISSCSTLDIVNKVEHFSLQQLESKVQDLTEKLLQSEQDRKKTQSQLEECRAEKELCYRRLEVVSAAHECRITEMHCVIAELSKKLRTKQENTILEEHDLDDISFQGGSVYNSEQNLTNSNAECQTELLVELNNSAGGDVINDGEESIKVKDDICRSNDTLNKGQVEALQEEVFHLKAQIALLQCEISNSFAQSTKGNEENENYNCSSERCYFDRNDRKQLNYVENSQLDCHTILKQYDPLKNSTKSGSISKMAERVKLRCTNKSKTNSTKENNIEKRKNITSVMELNDSMTNRFLECNGLETELQRLQRKIDHLKVRNTLLALTLDECKEHCEHLYLLCGKYESNAIALQAAVNCSDRAIEAYDVMLALLESKLALMKDRSVSSEQSRKAVESVARHLLDRLENEKNLYENSLGPWQNAFSIPDKVCASWTTEDDNRLRYHVSKLKGRRSTLQNTIVNLESPFSDYYEKSRIVLDCGNELKDTGKVSHMDLESVTFMQDLMNLREENIELKSNVEEANNERQYALSRANILQEALTQLQLQMTDGLLTHHSNIVENNLLYSEVEHAAITEQQLIEALSRESELKGRIQTLIASVAATQKISDEKYEQLHKNVKELQKSNISLNQLLEQNKRKYQSRTRKLEEKLMEISLEMKEKTNNAGTAQNSLHRMRAIKPLHDNNVPETTL